MIIITEMVTYWYLSLNLELPGRSFNVCACKFVAMLLISCLSAIEGLFWRTFYQCFHTQNTEAVFTESTHAQF